MKKRRLFASVGVTVALVAGSASYVIVVGGPGSTPAHAGADAPESYMPNLMGLSQAAATSEINSYVQGAVASGSLDSTPEIQINQANSPTMPAVSAGTVVEQQPGAGTPLTSTTQIVVNVGEGGWTTVNPDAQS